MGVLRESDGSWYLREEAGGLILGPYEQGAPCCYIDGPSVDSEYELFQEDLERLEPHIEAAIKRVPAFGEVGVKEVYNGAICYTPDGSPIVGPAWDLKNFWINEGHSFGITAAGGAGWQLADWMVEGAPSIDMLGVDPRRFGDYCSKAYLRAKNEEAYRNVLTIHYPDEERAAARSLRTAPCYDRMKSLGAVFLERHLAFLALLQLAGALHRLQVAPPLLGFHPPLLALATTHVNLLPGSGRSRGTRRVGSRGQGPWGLARGIRLIASRGSRGLRGS